MNIVNKIDNYFGVSAANSNFVTEVRAGITTFLAMAYILIVNPAILSKGIAVPGIDIVPQLLSATAIAAIVGSLYMGLFAKYPFAVAPGMGLNAFFTFTVILGAGLTWQQALAATFISSIIFIIITLTGLRGLIVDAMPLGLKQATTAGIGLFLAIIGFTNAGFITTHPETLVQIANLSHPGPILAFLGLMIMAALLAMRVRGAILVGMLVVTIIAITSGAQIYNGDVFAGFTNGVFQAPMWPKDLWLAMDFNLEYDFVLWGIVLSFLFVMFFDTTGSILGLAGEAGFMSKTGKIPRATQAFMADAVAATASSMAGTSPATCYIESATGIEDGGRTGLVAITVAALFFISMFFWPLLQVVPAVATAPALIIVGSMMLGATIKIDWKDYRISVPAFMTIAGIPFSYSIADGIALGIISHVLINLFSGKAKEVNWLMYLLAAAMAKMLLA